MMKRLITTSLLLTSMVSFAAEKPSEEEQSYKYQTSCSEIEYVIEGMNEKLPEDRQLVMECEDTYDEMFWGAVTKNHRSNISLTTSIPLCENAAQSYRQVIYPQYGVHLGISPLKVDRVIDILGDHSIDISIGASGSAVGTMYHIKSIQFPHCQ